MFFWGGSWAHILYIGMGRHTTDGRVERCGQIQGFENDRSGEASAHESLFHRLLRFRVIHEGPVITADDCLLVWLNFPQRILLYLHEHAGMAYCRPCLSTLAGNDIRIQSRAVKYIGKPLLEGSDTCVNCGRHLRS